MTTAEATPISPWTYYDLRGSNKWLVCQKCDTKGQEMFIKHMTLVENKPSSTICVSVSCGGCLPGDSPGAPIGNRNGKGRKRRSG